MKYINGNQIAEGQIILYPFFLDKEYRAFRSSAALPLGAYDPFRQLERSKVDDTLAPYVEFSNLDPDDPQKLLEYANTHGLPDSPAVDYSEIELYRDSEQELLQFLRQFQLSQDLLPYSVEKLKKEVLQMRMILEIKSVSKDNSSSSAAKVIDKHIKRGTLIGNRSKSAAILIRGFIERKLRGTSVTMKIPVKDGDFSFERLYRYRNLRQALYLTLLDDIASPVQKCANPKCNKYFAVTRKGKLYCETYCGVKVARRKFYKEWKK